MHPSAAARASIELARQKHPGAPSFTAEQIESKLKAVWPSLRDGVRVHLSDELYQPVEWEDVHVGSRGRWLKSGSWRLAQEPYWDCDDNASALVAKIKDNGYPDRRKVFPPACGTLNAYFATEPHAFVWFVDGTGTVRLYEPHFQQSEIPTMVAKQAWRAFDK